MRHLKSLSLLLLFFSSVILKLEAQTSDLPLQTVTTQDSLVLKKNDSERRLIIVPGEKIKIWLTGSNSEIGELKSIDQDTLVLLRHGIENYYLINDIEKIKIYAGPIGRILGTVFLIAGTGSIIFGGISLVVGIASIFANDLGVLILVAVPVLFGGGVGLNSVGNRLTGKSINLKSKWSIER